MYALTLNEVASSYLAAGDFVKRKTRIECYLCPLKKKASIVLLLSTVAFGLLLALFSLSLVGSLIFYKSSYYILYYILSVIICGLSILSIVSLFFLIYKYQNRKSFRVFRKYDSILPPELETLMEDLCSRKLRAYYRAEKGKLSLEPIETENGIFLGAPISPETFSNRYAPLLLSAQEGFWGHVMLKPWGPALRSPIYVLSKHPPESSRPPESYEIQKSPILDGNHLPASAVRGASGNNQDVVLLPVYSPNNATSAVKQSTRTEQTALSSPSAQAGSQDAERALFITSKLRRVPAHDFQDLFNFILQANEARRERGGRKWGRTQAKKWRIVIEAAHEFSLRPPGVRSPDETLLSACVNALIKAKKAEQIKYTGLRGETDTEDWVQGFIYNEGAYGWIHNAVDEFNSSHSL